MRRVAVAVIAICGILLAVCAVTLGVGAENIERASLGNAIAALHMSTQSFDNVDIRFTANGYLVLIDEDGGERIFSTSRMEESQIDWTKDGLGFVDSEHDYLLSDELRAIESPKADYQQDFRVLPHGELVGLYNDGFSGFGGYTEQIVVSGNDDARLTEVEGYYQVSGWCGDTLYGIAEPRGRYTALAEQAGVESWGEFAFTGLMFNQLTGTKSGVEEVISMHSVEDSDQAGSDVPCEGGILYHLASTYMNGGSQNPTPVLRKWNIITGEMQQVPLVDTNGKQIAKSEGYGFELRGLKAGAFHEGKLEWISLDGRLMSTNPETGVTDVKFEIEPDNFDPSVTARVHAFDGDRLVVVTVRFDEQLPGVYAEYDRDSGRQIRCLELPVVGKLTWQQLYFADLALAPTQ